MTKTPTTISAESVEYLSTLPTENLRNIAGREVFYGPVSNLLLVATAQAVLIARGAS